MPAIVRRPCTGPTRWIGPILVGLLAVASPIAPGPGNAGFGRSGEPAEGVDRCRRPWVTPVDAPVIDPFRPPEGPYGPGNRGIQYGTRPGQDVLAIGGGVIRFAGPVAGRPVVVVDHGAGLRSSYVNLTERIVDRGQQVARGQTIARSDAAFHLGVRHGDVYVDPAPMLGQLCEVIRLVAVPDP